MAPAPYRTPVFSQDLDGSVLGNCPRQVPSIVLKDVTNTAFPYLSISEEAITDTLHPYAEAGRLQLSLSQTQMTIEQNPRVKPFIKLDFETATNMKDYDNDIFESNPDGQLQSLVRNDKEMNPTEFIVPNQFIPSAACLSSCSTELSLISAEQSRAIKDDNRLPADKSHQEKNLCGKSPVRDRKSIKAKNAIVSNEDVQAAIELTVATAETLVIADMLNGCEMCKNLGPTAILDAALSLRRERDALGLNVFILEDQQCMPHTDLKWQEDLADDALDTELYEEPLADLMEKGPSRNVFRLADMSSGQCSAEKETAEVCGTPLTTSSGKGLCRNTSRLAADMQPNLCPMETDTAIIEVQKSTRATNAEHLKIHGENNSSERTEIAQGTLIRQFLAINEKADENGTSFNCIQAQVVTSRDLFNSRWLGGWTGVNCSEDEQAWSTERQLEKRQNCLLKFETSELSETYNVPSQAQSYLGSFRDFQNKVHTCVKAAVPDADPEALSAGSCAEILLALSQASVKCSSQEPLCSFVPCSVNVKVNSSVTDPPRCKYDEFTDKMTKNCSSNAANVPISGSDDKCLTEPYGIPGNSLGGHTKRTTLDSLKNYSTISSIHQNAMQPSENHFPNLFQVDRSAHCENGSDKTLKAAGSMLPSEKSIPCELIFKDSAVQDSPPLIWHRGKRRRLRACQVIESDFISGTLPEGMNCTNAVDTMIKLPEVEFNNEVYKKPIKQLEDKIQPVSYDDQPILDSFYPNEDVRNVEEQCPMTCQRQQKHDEIMKRVTIKQKPYNLTRRRSSSNQIFCGVSFLVTGFLASQKNVFEELCTKIQSYGGVIMSSVPRSPSSNGQKMLLRRCSTSSKSIVIAPRKVRTLKYLYGCAAGLLIVRPSWLDEMISKTSLIFGNNKEATKDLIFTGVSAYIHGQQSYCCKLSLLVQHGAGKVVRSIKSLVQPNDVEKLLIRVIVAEHQSKLSQTTKDIAARSGLPIVSGDWIIDSLLNGRLLSLPVAATDVSQAGKVSASSKTGTVRRKFSGKRKLGLKHSPLFVAKPRCRISMESQQEGATKKPCISFLGQGGRLNLLSNMGLSFLLDSPEASDIGKTATKAYYKSMCMDGIIYTAGDLVEVKPETEEVNEPYVAQIESFYAKKANGITLNRANSGSRREPRKLFFLCCRWFYRPSDTCFDCVGNDKELYLSQHFDENAPVSSIIKKVRMVLVIGDMTFINEERGWIKATQNSCAVQAADYRCRFFYDYHKESLHQLKAALTSSHAF